MNINQLLRPEELSDAELITVLTSLDVAVSFDIPRSHLLDIYRKVALPLPQRQKSSTKSNAKFTHSTETKSSNELDSFKSAKREQIPITCIVDNTKKMKLIDSCHRGSYPEAMDECSDESYLQVDRDSARESSKRKQCADFTDHIKRIKITP